MATYDMGQLHVTFSSAQWRKTNHEIEKTDGLDESESKNGVREELATERWVAGDGVEESSEDKSDTNSAKAS